MGMSQVSQQPLVDHLSHALASLVQKYEDESGLPETFISACLSGLEALDWESVRSPKNLY